MYLYLAKNSKAVLRLTDQHQGTLETVRNSCSSHTALFSFEYPSCQVANIDGCGGDLTLNRKISCDAIAHSDIEICYRTTLRQAMLRCARLRYAVLRHATLRYAVLRYATLRYAMLCYLMLHCVTLYCAALRCTTQRYTARSSILL